MNMDVIDQKAGNPVDNGGQIADLLQALLAAMGQGTAPLLMFCLQLEAKISGSEEHAYVHLHGMLSETTIFNVEATQLDQPEARKILLKILAASIDLEAAEWVVMQLQTTQADGEGWLRLGARKVDGTWQLPDNWLGETDKPPGWFSRMLTRSWEWINRHRAG